ncbi:MAG: DUF1996 domain-containing protein, partial [Rubrobacteraceae bacterium]
MLLACVLALLAALVAAPAAPAATTDSDVWFLVRCDFSNRSPDDPIVHPTPEHAHSHDFFGNKTTYYGSTYDSMSEPGTPTTCSRPKDTAAYWFPTVSWNGKELTPNRVNFYYRAGDKDLTTVMPFPADLKVITSNVRWYCGTDDTTAGSKDPPKLCKGGMLGVRIVFPDCIAKGDLTDPNLTPVSSTSNYRAGEKIDPATGQVIDPDTGQVIDIVDDDPDSPDHRLHMARSVLQSDGTRSCPDTHPILVPTLTLNATFTITKQAGRVTLSSGDASTMHADFWNTWDQTELERFANRVVPCKYVVHGDLLEGPEDQ